MESDPMTINSQSANKYQATTSQTGIKFESLRRITHGEYGGKDSRLNNNQSTKMTAYMTNATTPHLQGASHLRNHRKYQNSHIVRTQKQTSTNILILSTIGSRQGEYTDEANIAPNLL